MKKSINVTIRMCDRLQCNHTWIDGQESRRVPVPCEALKAEFCGYECHARAHVDEGHGRKSWRRKKMPKRVLRATSPRGY